MASTVDTSVHKDSGAAVYRRVYVWELPVRLFHWINALCIVVLCITGYLIGEPMRLFYAAEAYQQFWFGWVRFIHFVFAFIFTFNLLFRFYWGFVGNVHVRWKTFLPLKKSQRREFLNVLKADMLQIRLHGPITTGHNALATVVYLMLFFASAVQIILGFALYSSMSLAWLPQQFTWVVQYFGSEFDIRFIHHLLMWFFITFVIGHVYITFFHDYIEGRGVVSSIISGTKFNRQKPPEC